ncbi:MAG: hypothetical protein WC511_02085 [Candidatus Pacearchaeota archaeon]
MENPTKICDIIHNSVDWYIQSTGKTPSQLTLGCHCYRMLVVEVVALGLFEKNKNKKGLLVSFEGLEISRDFANEFSIILD